MAPIPIALAIEPGFMNEPEPIPCPRKPPPNEAAAEEPNMPEIAIEISLSWCFFDLVEFQVGQMGLEQFLSQYYEEIMLWEDSLS